MIFSFIRIVALLLAYAQFGVVVAKAETVAVVTADLNLRAGPGTTYPVADILPAGSRVVTYGCVASYTWCDVNFGTSRGWVSAGYLSLPSGGSSVVVSAQTAPRIGLTVVAFDQGYWDRYYIGRPWYGRGPAYYGSASVSGSASCANGTCSASRSASGPHGRSVSRSGSATCAGRNCSGTREATGRFGNSVTRTREFGR